MAHPFTVPCEGREARYRLILLVSELGKVHPVTGSVFVSVYVTLLTV